MQIYVHKLQIFAQNLILYRCVIMKDFFFWWLSIYTGTYIPEIEFPFYLLIKKTNQLILVYESLFIYQNRQQEISKDLLFNSEKYIWKV